MPPITTPAQAEKAALKLLADQAEAEQIAEAIKEAQAKAAAQLTPQLTKLQERIAAAKAELQEFIVPQLDAKTRSLVFGSARIGMKSGPPAVAFEDDTDEADVIGQLQSIIAKGKKGTASAIATVRAMIAEQCLKVTTTLNKAAVKSQLTNQTDKTGADMLTACGVTLKSSETLTVTQA